MGIKKYLIVDSSDICTTYVSLYEGDEAMLRAAQDKDLDHIEVYEVTKKVKLESRPAIIMSAD